MKIRLLLLAFLTALAGIISGCNDTADGIGDDIEDAGDEIEDAVN